MIKLVLFSFWTIGFIWLAIRIEIYFLYKSINAFKELKEARNKLQESKQELLNIIERNK